MTVHSGFEYGAADGVDEALAGMEEGAGSQNMDRQACTDMGSYADAVPTIVTHGQEDDIVQPINGCQAAERTTQTLDLVGDGVDDDVDTLTEIIEEYQRLEIDANPVDRVAPWNIRRTYWEKRTDLVR